MKKNEFKCQLCGEKTVTTNTRKYENYELRRKKCKECNIMYTIIYKDDKYKIANIYQPTSLKRFSDLIKEEWV